TPHPTRRATVYGHGHPRRRVGGERHGEPAMDTRRVGGQVVLGELRRQQARQHLAIGRARASHVKRHGLMICVPAGGENLNLPSSRFLFCCTSEKLSLLVPPC